MIILTRGFGWAVEALPDWRGFERNLETGTYFEVLRHEVSRGMGKKL